MGYVAATVEDDAIVGVLNLSEIVRGAFESAYLGYYVLAPYAARGYMTEALVLLLAVGSAGHLASRLLTAATGSGTRFRSDSRAIGLTGDPEGLGGAP